MRILFAEHRRRDARAITDAMLSAALAVDTVGSGDQALERLRTDSYDVAVLASDLPTLTGLQVLQLMRDRRDDTPVLILMKDPTPEARTDALRSDLRSTRPARRSSTRTGST